MSAQGTRPSVNGVMPKKATPAKRPNVGAARKAPNAARAVHQKATPIANKAASVAGDNPASGATSAYAIMASRIANRVAEMAESITFVER